MEPPEGTAPDLAGAPAPGAAHRPRRGGRFGALLSGALVAGGVGLLGITVAGRQIAAPWSVLAALVVFLPYLYVLLLGAAFALWTAIPDRRSPPVVLASTFLVAAGLWGPSWGAWGEAAPEDEVVRVMSWNLRRLWGGPDDGGDPAACVASAIAASAPDVLTLLEVSAADVARLERAVGLRCVHQPYRASESDKVGGLAVCARGDWNVSGGGQRFVDDEDWYYVLSEVRSGEQVFNVIAVHLRPYDYAARRLGVGVRELAKGQTKTLAQLGQESEVVTRGQSNQAAALLQRVGRLKDPTVVAGDFNSTRDASLHASLRGHLTDTWERGGFGFGATIDVGDWLPLRVDYVYASRDFAVVGAYVPQLGCSDHRPVVTELTPR